MVFYSAIPDVKPYCKLCKVYYDNFTTLVPKTLATTIILNIIILYLLLLSSIPLSFLIIFQIFLSVFLAIWTLFIGYLTTILLDQNRLQSTYNSCCFQEILSCSLRFCKDNQEKKSIEFSGVCDLWKILREQNKVSEGNSYSKYYLVYSDVLEIRLPKYRMMVFQ